MSDIKNRITELIREKAGENQRQEANPNYDKIKKILSNPIFNHAAICEKLWNNKDATHRSLFGKKLNQDKNKEGGTYRFSDEEVLKIISILMDTSSDVTQSFKQKQ